MSSRDVKSLLILSNSNLNCSFSILFHCANYWAQQGNRILFISKTPPKHLPFALGKADLLLDPDAIKLIQFMYLANWQELIKQLYSIHLRHYPVSVIIVKNLENYFKNDPQLDCNQDLVSLVCASLLYAISACAKIVSQPVFLINEYVCEELSIEKEVVKNFFHNIWELKESKDESDQTLIKLSKLSVAMSNEIVNYTFCEDSAKSMLNFDEIIKIVINLY